MPVWQIKKLWREEEINAYREYMATEATKLVGGFRSTCEDLALTLTIHFAEKNGLPVRFVNGANPKGLRPDQFDDLTKYINKVLISTGASDLFRKNTVKLVKGAMVGEGTSLGLATKGDLILLYSGPGHVQIVVSGAPAYVEIVQGNFRPEAERCSKADRWWNDRNQNDPFDQCYIGAIVAKRIYEKVNNQWLYENTAEVFKEDGRLCIWDFQAWNNEVTEHIVQSDDTLSSLAQRYYRDGNDWKRIYENNSETIGDNPDNIRPGTKLYIWN